MDSKTKSFNRLMVSWLTGHPKGCVQAVVVKVGTLLPCLLK